MCRSPSITNPSPTAPRRIIGGRVAVQSSNYKHYSYCAALTRRGSSASREEAGSFHWRVFTGESSRRSGTKRSTGKDFRKRPRSLRTKSSTGATSLSIYPSRGAQWSLVSRPPRRTGATDTTWYWKSIQSTINTIPFSSRIRVRGII